MSCGERQLLSRIINKFRKNHHYDFEYIFDEKLIANYATICKYLFNNFIWSLH